MTNYTDRVDVNMDIDSIKKTVLANLRLSLARNDHEAVRNYTIALDHISAIYTRNRMDNKDLPPDPPISMSQPPPFFSR